MVLFVVAACGGPAPTPATATPPGSPSAGRTAPPSAAATASPAPTTTPSAGPSGGPATDASTTQAVTAASWDSQNGLVGLALTGTDGSSFGELQVTHDGGRTWVATSDTRDPVVQVAVAGSADAWALTSCAGDTACGPRLYRTTDAGQTWTAAVTDLTWVSFADPLDGWGVAGGFPGTGAGVPALQRTRDGGRTWTTLPSPCAGSKVGPLRAVSFPSVTSGLAVCALTAGAGGELHAVLATDDGGRHWAVRASTGGEGDTKPVGRLPYGGYITGIVVAPDGTAWIAGQRMVPLSSRDGGITWRPLALGDAAVDLVQAAWPLDARRGVAVMWSPERQATLYEATTDGGRTWTVRSAWPVTGLGEGLVPSPGPSSSPGIETWTVGVLVSREVVFAGDRVEITATTDETGGGTDLLVSSVTFDFGDGSSATIAGACTAGVTVVHAYRASGAFTPHVAAATSCDPAVAADLSVAEASVFVYPAAPAGSASWPTCDTTALHMSGSFVGAGLGNVATRITLTNVSRRACRLEGYPDVVLVGRGGRLLPTHATPASTGAYLFPTVVPHAVALAPGESASFMLGYTDNPLDQGVPYAVACPSSVAVRVILPGTHRFGTARVPMGACGGVVVVSPVVPGAAGIRFP
jgi:hypothetical protein